MHFCLDEKLCHREKEVFKELKSIHNNSSEINPDDEKESGESILEQENSKNFYRDLEVLEALNQKTESSDQLLSSIGLGCAKSNER